MSQWDIEQNHQIIMEALNTYAQELQHKQRDPLKHFSEAEKVRYHYLRALLTELHHTHTTNKTGLPIKPHQRQLDHRLLMIALESLLRLRQATNYGDNSYFRKRQSHYGGLGGSGAINQQNQMYNNRIKKREIRFAFITLAKPYLVSLNDENQEYAQRIDGRYSPMEVIHLLLSNEDSLATGISTEASIARDADALNHHHPDVTVKVKQVRNHYRFKRLISFFKK